MPVVEFQPLGRRMQVSPGATVLEAVQLLGRELGDWGVVATCGGHGRCGRCLVRVVGGAVSGADEQELELLARQGAVGYRLACRVRVLGDVRVELDRVKRGDRLQVAGVLGVREVHPRPVVRQVQFSIAPPAVGERAGPVGNAAGMGAYLALVSEDERREAARVARSAGYLELMTLPGYQELFLSCLSFS